MRKVLSIGLLIFLIGGMIHCGGRLANDPAELEDVIPISIKSDPRGADVYMRIDSDSPEVHSTNRVHLGTTPYYGNRKLNIPGLDDDNKDNVYIVIEVEKRGYIEATGRFNIFSVLNDRKINTKFRLSKRR